MVEPQDLTVAELQQNPREKHLQTIGNKEELILRIQEANPDGD